MGYMIFPREQFSEGPTLGELRSFLALSGQYNYLTVVYQFNSYVASCLLCRVMLWSLWRYPFF